MKRILIPIVLLLSCAWSFSPDGRMYFVYRNLYDRKEYLMERDPHYPNGYWYGSKDHNPGISVEKDRTDGEPDKWTFIRSGPERISPEELEGEWYYVGYFDENSKFVRIYIDIPKFDRRCEGRP